MARRKVDMAMLQELVEGSQSQEVARGGQRSSDPNFPVFQTPVGQDILVYIPRTNVIATENGEDMQVLRSYIHQGRVGRQFVFLRCIHGLSGTSVFDALGYDGTCPACEATQEAWELYRLKLDEEARRRGIDPQNDPSDTLKTVRTNLLEELDMRNSEEYATFPIVVIPMKGKLQPVDDWQEKMQAQFVFWRRQRYNDTLLAALDSLINNPGHPAGLFWLWKFTYDTKGKQANARDAARNAKFTVIQDPNVLSMLEPIRAVAEEKAKEFTLLKAAEVVIPNQFLYKEDLEIEVNKIMQKTRQLLELAKQRGVAALPQGQAQPQLGMGHVNPLANFGVAGQVAPAGIQQFGGIDQSAPMNIGHTPMQDQAHQASAQQGAPQGQPINFGQPQGQPMNFGQPQGQPINFGQPQGNVQPGQGNPVQFG